MTSNSATTISTAQDRFSAAAQQLSASHGALADVLASLTSVVVEEALQNAGFRARLTEALVKPAVVEAVGPHEPLTTEGAPASNRASAKARPKRARRTAGPWDLYNVYADVGEAGLRQRLSQLELEQLRDIIAEHGMNTDGLAMRWTKVDRVVSRIVDRVVNRSAKGDAFRVS